MDDIPKTETEWRTRLAPDAYYVLREGGTEPAFTGEYTDCKKAGIYVCKGCGKPLFRSEDKFASDTGWPSYTSAIEGAVQLKPDYSHDMVRTEVLCSTCGCHLGHVFNDFGVYERYCINSVALHLQERQRL